MKKALITGIYGQDGSFLYELLRSQNYQIYGIVRKKISDNSKRIKKELAQMGKLPATYETDLLNYDAVRNLIKELQVDEIYHLSASHVSSEGIRNGNLLDENKIYKDNVNATANILAACNDVSKGTKILTAGSCLVFDDTETVVQDEQTPFRSKSLYGLGKIAENQLVKYYRKKGLYACTAILYNHESHRRSTDFVTRKIVKNMCIIKQNPNHRFSLGNIDVKKDWGYAGDYVQAMQMMLQMEKPKDFIVASGSLYSIRDFINICAELLHINQWEQYVDINQTKLSRDNRIQLCGNPEKIKKELRWAETKTLRQIVEKMIEWERNYI